jgi:hypothetical protein
MTIRKITFYPANELEEKLTPPPQKVQIPEWFKKMPLHLHGDKKLVVRNGEPNYSAKICMPFLDTFTTGYTFNLPYDIIVQIDPEGYQVISWASDLPAPVTARPVNQNLIPYMKGHTDWNFSWLTHWGIKLPRGYSALLTHPLNRTDLPFITASGILDADKWGVRGNQPFSLQEGFEGIIYQGTPIIQIIPFKRYSWISTINKKLTKWAFYEDLRRSRVFRGYYKDNYWTKKDYS